jgi:hypothetical protein
MKPSECGATKNEVSLASLSPGGHQNFTLSAAAHAADQTRFFHVFDQTSCTVVPNLEVTLHQ